MSSPHKLESTIRDKVGNISIIVVAFSNIFLEGIQKILEPESDIQIIGKTLYISEIFPLIEVKKPDVLCIDSSIPNLDIEEVIVFIREKSVETKLLLLLQTIYEESIIGFLSMGIHGYLKPTEQSDHLVKAIRAICKGEIWAERNIISKLLKRVLGVLPREKIKQVIEEKLTKREKEIIELVILDYRNKEIAKKLYISENTVKAHLVHIFKKIGASDRHHLGDNLPVK